MKGLAWRSALDRPLSLAGSFVALALSVGLLGAMTLTIVSAVSGTRLQPHWFTRAAVVVAGDDTVSVTTGTGDDRETETVRTPAARAVPAALAARLASLASAGSGTAAVTDYAGYGQAAGAPGQAIHPWAAAGLHPYRWVAGGPPDGPGQLVLTAPARYAPGQPVTVQTAAGPRRFTVSGVLATPAPAAFYAADTVARQLAGNRISAVALTPRAGQDTAALARQARSDARGLPVQVLTGDRRGLAEPDPDSDLVAVASALLGSAAGVAGFVSMIVLAGTFGYAVAARRRELGLLRTTGATPRQVRRLVLGEALITGAAGAAAGTALGPVIAGPFAALLAREGFAPAGLTIHVIFWPLAAAFGAGLLIALGGALAAARRAGRTRPAEALRKAGRDRRVMTAFRWAAGPATLAGAAV
ncbi:MAG TPA: FtsX-like permease family protein, partial [Streptosporangiaceae bacterium]|nr:FtsX-like permease family protein [Streptosporangiaceae bacterium]